MIVKSAGIYRCSYDTDGRWVAEKKQQQNRVR